MKPARFKYVAAETLEQALDLKAEHRDEASFLAGGQSLVPVLNFRLAQPAVLIDINPLTQLSGLMLADGVVRIGALTRYRTLERDPTVAKALPLIREALPHIAHPQIRNRGTIGGNLAHADPASELPAIAVALGGRLRAQSVRGERWIDAAAFFLGPLTTALETDEMLVEIELPAAPGRSGFSFMEVSRRRGDFAMMGVAAWITLDDGGTCTSVRMALCGAGDTPVDVSGPASSLVGGRPDDSNIGDVAAAVRAAVEPAGNIHASKEYQRHLAGVMTRRALRTAVERAAHA